MPSILLADIHLDDRSDNAYRWKLLPWVKEQYKKYDCCNLFVLGDLTTAKDRHNSYVVNKLVDQLNAIHHACPPGFMTILMGNHDYVDRDYPFFEFVKHMGINFARKRSEWFCPVEDFQPRRNCLFLPATNDPERDWGDEFEYHINHGKQEPFDYIFVHGSFDGVLSENGTKLSGADPKIFRGTQAKIWAGDIHVPQRLKFKGGYIEYVGAPYHTRFGDQFEPRVVLIQKDGSTKDLYFPAPRKLTVEIRSINDLEKELKRAQAVEEDHVKVRVRLLRSEYPDWPSLRKEVIATLKDYKMNCFGPELLKLEDPLQNREKDEKSKSVEKNLSPAELIRSHAKLKRVPKDSLEVGLSLLEEVQ